MPHAPDTAEATQEDNLLKMLKLEDVAWGLQESAKAAIASLGGLDNRNLFFHNSGGWKFQIKVSARLVSSEASLLSLWMATFSLCLVTIFLL